MTARYFLAQGDRAGSAWITEGLPNFACAGARIATIGMATYCSQCNTFGHVFPVGERPRGTAPNGQQWALSGDLNVCLCGQQPFVATRILRTNAGTDCSYLNTNRQRVLAPAHFYKHNNPVKIEPVARMEYVFEKNDRSRTYDTQVYNVTTQGYTFPLRAPAGDLSQLTQWVLKGLENLPRQQLRHIGWININPGPRISIRPNFITDAVASFLRDPDLPNPLVWGGIDIFPTTNQTSQAFVDAVLLHESAHLWNMSWPRGWEEQYEATIQGDPAPSEYGGENIDEDFAETASLYWGSLDSPCEAQARQLHGPRFTFLDFAKERV